MEGNLISRLRHWTKFDLDSFWMSKCIESNNSIILITLTLTPMMKHSAATSMMIRTVSISIPLLNWYYLLWYFINLPWLGLIARFYHFTTNKDQYLLQRVIILEELPYSVAAVLYLKHRDIGVCKGSTPLVYDKSKIPWKFVEWKL